MGAAVAVVIATRGSLHGAAPVRQAEGSDRHGAAAGGPSRTLVSAVTNLHGWGWGGGAGWAGWGVGASFDGIRRLHGDPALAVDRGRVSDETDVTGFAPIRSPGVLDDPVGRSGIGPITDCHHTVVELVAAGVIEDTLKRQLEEGVSGSRFEVQRWGDATFAFFFSFISHSLFYSFLLFFFSFSFIPYSICLSLPFCCVYFFPFICISADLVFTPWQSLLLTCTTGHRHNTIGAETRYMRLGQITPLMPMSCS